MANLCIIPARGGSKRIPRKNIRPFLGKPIISYSIEVALASQLFDEVMVSTEDEEIAEIALKYGAKVPFFRSEYNAGDFATTVEVVMEVLDGYGRSKFDTVCCIYSCAPFVTIDLLKQAETKLHEEKLDSVFPIIAYGHPIQRALLLNEKGHVFPVAPEYISTRSQDLEKRYRDAGQFYFGDVNALFEKKKMWTDNSGGIEIDEMAAHDIDTDADWMMAELKYKLIHGI